MKVLAYILGGLILLCTGALVIVVIIQANAVRKERNSKRTEAARAAKGEKFEERTLEKLDKIVSEVEQKLESKNETAS